MKNLYLTPADFWQERDFGAKITAMFEFLKAHWRPLGKCLVYFVLPAALLLGIGLGVFYNGIYNEMGIAAAAKRAGTPRAYDSPINGVNFWGMAVAALGFAASLLLLLSTVYGYLRARLQLPASEVASPARVWAAMRERLGRMVLAMLVFFGAYAVLLLGFFFVFGLLVAQRGNLATSVPLLVLGFFALLILATYLGVVLSLYFPVLWLEEVSVFGAVGRSFQLIRGSWWATFGLVLVASLLQSALSIVFLVPQYAVLIGKMLQLPYLGSDVLGLVTQMIYSTGLLLTYPILLVTLAFQYFNLAEAREGYGLRLLVGELGQAAPEAYSQHYRPEEEQY